MTRRGNKRHYFMRDQRTHTRSPHRPFILTWPDVSLSNRVETRRRYTSSTCHCSANRVSCCRRTTVFSKSHIQLCFRNSESSLLKNQVPETRPTANNWLRLCCEVQAPIVSSYLWIITAELMSLRALQLIDAEFAIRAFTVSLWRASSIPTTITGFGRFGVITLRSDRSAADA